MGLFLKSQNKLDAQHHFLFCCVKVTSPDKYLFISCFIFIFATYSNLQIPTKNTHDTTSCSLKRTCEEGSYKIKAIIVLIMKDLVVYCGGIFSCDQPFQQLQLYWWAPPNQQFWLVCCCRKLGGICLASWGCYGLAQTVIKSQTDF